MILEGLGGNNMTGINRLIEEETKALELTYFDIADVYRNIDSKNGNLNKKQRICVIKEMSCALSKKYVISSKVDNVNSLEGEYVLFCSQEILKGDEIHLATMNGKKYILLAGLPNDLISHYEIPVSVRERA